MIYALGNILRTPQDFLRLPIVRNDIIIVCRNSDLLKPFALRIGDFLDYIAAGGSDLSILYNGTLLTDAATSINFTGAGQTTTNVGGAVLVTIPGGSGSSILLQTNSVDNTLQTVLNLIQSGNIVITSDGLGRVTIGLDLTIGGDPTQILYKDALNNVVGDANATRTDFSTQILNEIAGSSTAQLFLVRTGLALLNGTSVANDYNASVGVGGSLGNGSASLVSFDTGGTNKGLIEANRFYIRFSGLVAGVAYSYYFPLSDPPAGTVLGYSAPNVLDWIPNGSGGTVTSVSSGDLAPLFTVIVSNPTTTPAFAFTLTAAAARTWFGNNTAGSLAPAFNAAGALAEAVSSVLTITGGANALLNGATIQVKLAGTAQDGYLSATDWNTFNNKLAAAITSLNGLTASVQLFATGTTGTDFAIVSTTATHTFNLPTASATNRGALSSADWTTFNSKQNAITPAALTKADDTNVTLTLGGTPASALLQSVLLTLGWTGILSIARGGTGLGALGTALQMLRVNAGATAFEYFTPAFITTTLTNAHILVGNGSNVATDVAMSGDVTISNAGVTTVASNIKYFQITINISGSGGVIQTGNTQPQYPSINFAGTITGWDIIGGTSGSIEVAIYKSTYAALPPVAPSIFSPNPILSSAQKATASGLSIAVAQGDVITANIVSVTTLTTCTLTIKGIRT